MFPDVDPLPGPQVASAVGDGKGERVLGEDGADMGGHVVGTLGGVAELGLTVRNQPGEEVLQVAADARVSVLAEDERGTRVVEEDRAETPTQPAVVHDPL